MTQIYTSFTVDIEGIGPRKVLASSIEDAIRKTYNIYRLTQPDKTKYKPKRSILSLT